MNVWSARRGGMAAWGLILIIGWAGCTSSGSKDKDKQSQANQHYRLGLLSYQRGDLAKAIEELKISVRMNSDSELTHNLLGLVYLDSRQYDEAVSHFDRALQLNPYFTDVHNNLGTVFRKRGEFPQALESFSRALEDPTYRTPEKVHYNIGQTYLEMNDPVRAVESLKEALSITPKYGKARLELAKAFRSMGQHSEAKSQLEAVIRLLPDTEAARRAQDLIDAGEY